VVLFHQPLLMHALKSQRLLTEVEAEEAARLASAAQLDK
jgi:hypothetical protein